MSQKSLSKASETIAYLHSAWDLNSNGTLYTWTRKSDESGKAIPQLIQRCGPVCGMTYTSNLRSASKVYVAYGFKMAGTLPRGSITKTVYGSLNVIWVQESMQRNFGSRGFYDSIKQQPSTRSWLKNDELWELRDAEDTNEFAGKGGWMKNWIKKVCGFVLSDDQVAQSPQVQEDSSSSSSSSSSVPPPTITNSLPSAFGGAVNPVNAAPTPPTLISPLVEKKNNITGNSSQFLNSYICCLLM